MKNRRFDSSATVVQLATGFELDIGERFQPKNFSVVKNEN